MRARPSGRRRRSAEGPGSAVPGKPCAFACVLVGAWGEGRGAHPLQARPARPGPRGACWAGARPRPPSARGPPGTAAAQRRRHAPASFHLLTAVRRPAEVPPSWRYEQARAHAKAPGDSRPGTAPVTVAVFLCSGSFGTLQHLQARAVRPRFARQSRCMLDWHGLLPRFEPVKSCILPCNAHKMRAREPTSAPGHDTSRRSCQPSCWLHSNVEVELSRAIQIFRLAPAAAAMMSQAKPAVAAHHPSMLVVHGWPYEVDKDGALPGYQHRSDNYMC